MSKQVDSNLGVLPTLLAAAVKALSITVPIRSARALKDGSVEVWTRDGVQVWKPPKKKTAPESGSKPRASRKRAAPAKKEAKSERKE